MTDLEGVESVKIDRDAGTAEVTYDNSMVSTSDMKEAIEDQGYDVV